jgi:CRP-like cAMP-binding protein
MCAEIKRKPHSPLRKVDELFADLPPAELHELASALRPIEIEAGTDIVRIDDFGAAFYFIQAGEAEVIDGPDAAPGLSVPATRSAKSRSS